MKEAAVLAGAMAVGHAIDSQRNRQLAEAYAAGGKLGLAKDLRRRGRRITLIGAALFTLALLFIFNPGAIWDQVLIIDVILFGWWPLLFAVAALKQTRRIRAMEAEPAGDACKS